MANPETSPDKNSVKDAESEKPRLDFIRQIIADDLQSGKHITLITRFPPEPNGYLHIGHAKAVCLNFGIQEENQDVNARCHLRFDDTNPEKESDEYVRAIQEDIRWLGFDWGENLYFASDYFQRMHDCAVRLIEEGRAYVDDQTAEEIRTSRGTLTEPGALSPWRDRSVEENLDLFARMKAGEFPEGTRVLRAKIDMAAANVNLRDPVLYRILKARHHRTGDAWQIYPMYDFAHPLEDAFEQVTHSLCSLEFEDHRPLYDWVVDHCPVPAKPRQIEFARLNLTYTVMSKRKLLKLVEDELVSGWDDPRMPTLSGMRRRGYPPAAIRKFCATVGLTKKQSLTDVALLEHAVREQLNRTSRRYMAVMNPVRVVIENLPEGHEELLEGVLNPENPEEGSRVIPFHREIFIERDDFMEIPAPKYFRLAPGKEVRLRYAYTLTCVDFEKDPATGEVSLIRATIDPDTLGKNPVGRKVGGVIHWVSAQAAIPVETRLYDRLFVTETPEEGDGNFLDRMNSESLTTGTAMLEPAAAGLPPETAVQFERVGYFVTDRVDHTDSQPVFNRTVTLKDTWAKISG